MSYGANFLAKSDVALFGMGFRCVADLGKCTHIILLLNTRGFMSEAYHSMNGSFE